MHYLLLILKEIWFLTMEMAPYLLFGFFIAGLLHLMLNRAFIYRHLSGHSFLAVLKATLFGIPIPVCSCGVIPISAHLEKEGAGKGSVISFLISTPTSGIDSILATYALMGPIFALFRPIASFVGGLLAGTFVNRTDKSPVNVYEKVCKSCSIDDKQPKNRFIDALKYGFIELIDDTGKWLIIGIIAGGLISALVPDAFMLHYMSNAWIAYPLMMLIAIPMYVCATGSIPIAASLILKGMAPGAGLVFLIAGPATNTATISFILGKFGKKTLAIYLLSIITVALMFGLLLDYIWTLPNMNTELMKGGMNMLPLWIKQLSAIVLILLIMRTYIVKIIKRPQGVKGMNLLIEWTVNDMTCQHCVKTITNAVMAIDGIDDVHIDLNTKSVKIYGKADISELKTAIEQAGYSVKEE